MTQDEKDFLDRAALATLPWALHLSENIKDLSAAGKSAAKLSYKVACWLLDERAIFGSANDDCPIYPKLAEEKKTKPALNKTPRRRKSIAAKDIAEEEGQIACLTGRVPWLQK